MLSFVIGRKTIKKRMRANLLAIKTKLRRIGARCVSSARRDLCGLRRASALNSVA
jgi:hypothetical protein